MLSMWSSEIEFLAATRNKMAVFLENLPLDDFSKRLVSFIKLAFAIAFADGNSDKSA